MHIYMKGLYFNALINMCKFIQGKDKNIIGVAEDNESIAYTLDLETMEVNYSGKIEQ